MCPVPLERSGLRWASAAILLSIAGCATPRSQQGAHIVWQAPVRWGSLCDPITPESTEHRLGYRLSAADADFLETACRQIAEEVSLTGDISDTLGDFFLALPVDQCAPMYELVWNRVEAIEAEHVRRRLEDVVVTVSFANLTLDAFCRELSFAANETFNPALGEPGIVIRCPCTFSEISRQSEAANLISYDGEDVSVLDVVREVSARHYYYYMIEPYSVWIGCLHQPLGSEWQNPAWSCAVAEAWVPEALRRLLDTQPCHSAVVDQLAEFGLAPGPRGLVAYDREAGRLVRIGPSETAEIFMRFVDGFALRHGRERTFGVPRASGKEQ